LAEGVNDGEIEALGRVEIEAERRNERQDGVLEGEINLYY